MTTYTFVFVFLMGIIVPVCAGVCTGQCNYELDEAFNSTMCEFETEGYEENLIYDYYVEFQLDVNNEYTFLCGTNPPEELQQCPFCRKIYEASEDCRRKNAPVDVNGNEIVGRNIQSCYCTYGYQGILGSSPAEHECQACPVGKFKDQKFVDETAPDYLQLNQDNFGIACQDCPGGAYASYEASASCTLCSAGKYLNFTGAVSNAQCQSCPLATFSGAGDAVCTNCPAGKKTSSIESVSIQDCKSFCRDEDGTSHVLIVGEASYIGSRMPSGTSNFDLICPATKPVITRIDSTYDDYYERRKWEIWCATLNGGSIAHDTCRWTQASTETNSGDTSDEFKCSLFEVMAGINSTYVIGGTPSDKWGGYRSYGVYCCTLRLPGNTVHFYEAQYQQGSRFTNFREDFSMANVDPWLNDINAFFVQMENSDHYNEYATPETIAWSDRQFKFYTRHLCFKCSAPGAFGYNCSTCPVGMYPDTVAFNSLLLFDINTQCIKCPAGTYWSQFASTVNETCATCPAGTYSEQNGLDSIHNCTSCSAGKYSTALYATTNDTCQSCPAGTYSEAEGVDSREKCMLCPAGTYLENAGAVSEHACLSCEAGKFSDIEGRASRDTCQNCSTTPGYFCNLGSSNQSGELCHAGYRCPGGSANQEACPPGTFAAAGSSICSACTPGSYSDTDASGACVDCPDNETSPYYSENASSCFAFEPAMEICPPGFFQDAADQRCKPCTHIGGLDEYEIHWRRALRYTHYRTPESFSAFYPDGNISQYIHLLQQEKDNRQTFKAWDRFSIHPDRLARHCGLTHDAVDCPHGLVYDPSSPSQCKLPLPTANATRADCTRGSYFDTTDQACHPCPRNLTTLHDGASGVAACLFCNPADYLDASGEDEACVPCHAEDTCMTTQAFGGAEAHRMSSCSIPCGPEHMREKNQSTYQCFFSRCMHRVRAQDIHPCVFTENGTVQTNASESRCHPYFVPLAPDWVEVAKEHRSSFDSKNDIFPGSGYLPYENDYGGYSEYISIGNERVQHARQQMQYVDWYYLLFTTNTVRKELGDNFTWPHIQANKQVPIDGGEKNSEEVVFDKILHDAGLLFLKDAQVLHETAVAMDNSSLSWPQLSSYKSILRWTDLVRHAYEFYQENYVEPWVDEQCSNLQENNHNEMYHCHIKAFAWKPEPIQWRLSMGTTEDACGTSCQGGIPSECGRDENDIKEQLFNQTHHALTRSYNVSQVAFDDLEQSLQGIRIDLHGIEEDVKDLDSIDSCLWQEWVQNFTSEYAWAENISAICGNNTEACSNGNWPWLCYNTCKTHLEDQCPEIKLRRDTSMDKYAVLDKTIFANLYDSDEPYMEGEAQFLEQTKQNICNLTQSDRQAMLRKYAPEFPGGDFFTFLNNLRDRIEEYWNQHPYTCHVTFDDNATRTYPCIFEETTGGDYEISFVDHVDAENYTLTVTYRADNGVQQNITHVEKVDQNTTRPFCQIADPVEFNMVHTSVDFL